MRTRPRATRSTTTKAAASGAVLEPCLGFDHVSFAYDSQPAVEDINFVVRRGEFASILGPNGSGKTTLLKLVLGLVKPNRGIVSIFGEPVDEFRSWWRVGYVPQSVEGVSHQSPITVEEVVAQGLYRGFDPFGVWRRSNLESVVRSMEEVGVADLRRRRVSSLSAGQQQRVLVARALIRQPDLLVLDEPVAGVDAAGQEVFYSILRRLNQDQGITILIVTHDIGVVMREATTVACINRTMVFHGPPHKITRDELSALYGLQVDVLLHDALHEHR